MLALALASELSAQADAESAEPGLRALAQMRFAAAERAATAALQAHPDHARWQYVLAEAMANQTGAVPPTRLLGHARRTRAAYERAYALDSSDVVVLLGVAQFRLQAPRLLGGNKDEAVALAETARRLDPATATSVVALIRWKRDARGDRAAADGMVERHVQQHGADSTVRIRAAEYFFETARFARARDILLSHVAQCPADPAAQLMLGRSLAILGDYAGAKPLLERSVADWTERAWYPRLVAQWQLTRTFIGLRDTSAARASAERVLAIAPNHTGATRLLDSLRLVQVGR
jgi:hypothetical protein